MEGAVFMSAVLVVAASLLTLWGLISRRQERKERESARHSAK
jgi:hypothetical protein